MKVGDCRHFNGTVNACCKAGVNYEELAGSGDGLVRRLPCLLKYMMAGNVARCAEHDVWTQPEVDAWQSAVDEDMKKMAIARAAIVAKIGGQWKKGMADNSGSIQCPVCKGIDTLRFSRSGYNGHIHAQCVTDGCVAWME